MILLYTISMLKYLIRIWVPIAIASTIMMFTIFVVAQQALRQSANDPQIQMAEDSAAVLATGASSYSIVGNTKIDIGKSLAPFLIIYDEAGKVVASTGYLNTQIPVVPSGVLASAKTKTDSRITWQPATSTRLAAVVKYYSGKSSGYVVAARSLREIEIRESSLEFNVGMAWLVLIVVTFVTCLISSCLPIIIHHK